MEEYVRCDYVQHTRRATMILERLRDIVNTYSADGGGGNGNCVGAVNKIKLTNELKRISQH